MACLKAVHNSSPDGTHFIVEFFGCDRKQLNSVTFWKKTLSKMASAAGMKILNSHFYKFSPEGITAYLLLATSHISIHTWPEHRYIACDVFSCGREDKTFDAVNYIKENLCHEKTKLRRIKRGFRIFSEK